MTPNLSQWEPLDPMYTHEGGIFVYQTNHDAVVRDAMHECREAVVDGNSLLDEVKCEHFVLRWNTTISKLDGYRRRVSRGNLLPVSAYVLPGNMIVFAPATQSPTLLFVVPKQMMPTPCEGCLLVRDAKATGRYARQSCETVN